MFMLLPIVASLVLHSSANISQVTTSQVVEAAAVLGITPESLACIGISGADVDEVLDRLAEEFDEYQAYRGRLENAAAAHDRLVAARAAARLDPDDNDAIAELQSAETAVQAAISAAESSKADLIATLTESLCDQQDAACTLMNPQLLRLAPAYRPAELNEAGVQTLAWALALRERLGGESLPSAATSAISSAESQYRVQLALTRLQQHAEANQTAMQNWAGSDN